MVEKRGTWEALPKEKYRGIDSLLNEGIITFPPFLKGDQGGLRLLCRGHWLARNDHEKTTFLESLQTRVAPYFK